MTLNVSPRAQSELDAIVRLYEDRGPGLGRESLDENARKISATMNTLEEIRETVLRLPRGDRAVLAEQLLESLDPQTTIEEDELARIVVERAEALDRGETTADDWEDSFQWIQEEFSRRCCREAQD